MNIKDSTEWLNRDLNDSIKITLDKFFMNKKSVNPLEEFISVIYSYTNPHS